MPTPFGALPGGDLAPIAHAMIGRSIDYGGYYIDNATAVGTPLPDGGSGGFAQSVYCPRPCFLVAELQLALQGNRSAWDYAAFAVRITPADLDGVVAGNYLIAPLNSSLPVKTFHATYPFRCGVGSYTIQATWEGNQGGAASIYLLSKVASHLSVEVIGDSVV